VWRFVQLEALQHVASRIVLLQQVDNGILFARRGTIADKVSCSRNANIIESVENSRRGGTLGTLKVCVALPLIELGTFVRVNLVQSSYMYMSLTGKRHMWAFTPDLKNYIRECQSRAVPVCTYCKPGLGSSEADQKTVLQSLL